MTIRSVSVLYTLVIFFGGASAAYKRWLPDTNFDNPKNWNIKRSPCGNDVTIIPDDSPVVYVQLNTTIKELVLPRNGELILSPNFVLGFTEIRGTDCEEADGDVEFTAVHPEPWLNPENWCAAPTERGACDLPQMSLDVDKVPSGYDDVIFARDHTYFVDLSDSAAKISAKTLKIAGTTFTTYSFTNFVNTPDGSRMFWLPSSGVRGDLINITRRSCDDPRGCSSGNDRPEIAKAICAYVEKTCTRPRCSKTLQPVGGCCRICGAVFNVTRGYGFNFNDFVSSLRSSFLSASSEKEVNMTASVTSEGWVQIVLTDRTGEKSASIAKRMQTEFNNDRDTGGHIYAIDGVKLALSSTKLEPSAHTGVAIGGGSIAGIVFGVIIIIAIIIVVIIVFVFRRTGRGIHIPKLPKMHLPNMPHLPSFPGHSHRTTGAFSKPHTASHIDPGFANPMYDSSPFDDANSTMKEMELIAGTLEEQPTFDVSEGGFQNPLFGTSGPSMFRDPTSVQEPGQEGDQGKKGTPTSSSSSRVGAATTVNIDNPNYIDRDSTI